MKHVKEMDVFTTNPIVGIRNVGCYEHAKNWKWVCDGPYHAFYYIAEGSWSVEINGQQILVQQGEVLYLREGTDAVIATELDQTTHYFISFYCEKDFDLGIKTTVKTPDASRLFSQIHDTFHSDTSLGKLKVAYLFLQLILTLAEGSGDGEPDPVEETIQKATAYININYAKELSLGDLCQITGYSQAHLRRLFLRYHGTSPSQYIIGLRLDKARELLLELPDRTTEEIADQLGFCSPSYFCKLFRKKTGITPMEYRKTVRNSATDPR